MVTGFRYAVGGAVVGRRDIMAVFESKAGAHWSRYQMVPHPGTFNANPLSAAAGVAAPSRSLPAASRPITPRK